MSRSGSFGAIPAGAARRRRRLSSVMLRFASRKERVESRHLWSGGQELPRVATKKKRTRHHHHAGPRPLLRSHIRRCKIPAYEICASPNLLTLGIPAAILGGSWRQPLAAFGGSAGTRGRSSVGRALEWHSRGQGF